MIRTGDENRARILDMAHDPAPKYVMTEELDDEVNALGNALPHSQEGWWGKRRSTDCVIEDVGGVVTRFGDETVGEMWSLYDDQDALNFIPNRTHMADAVMDGVEKRDSDRAVSQIFREPLRKAAE